MGKKKDEIPWRLIAKSRNVYYKICSFWGWNKDATLNFKLYSKKRSRIYEVEEVTEERIENEDGSTTVHQRIFYDKVKPTDFYTNKRTFHPSGFIHETDNDGIKYKLGVKSLPFHKIEHFRHLMWIFPRKYDYFPSIKENKFRSDDVIFDLSIFNHYPFCMDVFIIRGDRVPKIYPNKPDKCIKSIEIFCGQNQKYLLFIRCYQTSEMLNQKFPPNTYIATPVLSQKNTD